MSIKQRLIHSIAAHPGYVIFISLAVVAIVSVMLGTIGIAESGDRAANALGVCYTAFWPLFFFDCHFNIEKTFWKRPERHHSLLLYLTFLRTKAVRREVINFACRGFVGHTISLVLSLKINQLIYPSNVICQIVVVLRRISIRIPLISIIAISFPSGLNVAHTLHSSSTSAVSPVHLQHCYSDVVHFQPAVNIASIRIPATATGIITNLTIGLCTIYSTYEN